MHERLDDGFAPEPDSDANHDLAPERTAADAGSGLRSVAVSLSFWLTLLLAAGLYASVALAPKLADWIRVRQVYLQNADRLAQLEARADQSERIVAALRRQSTATSVTNASVILAGQNSPDPDATGADIVALNQSAKDHGLLLRSDVVQLINRLATDSRIRKWLLIAAGVLIVAAFTFLNDAEWRWPGFFRRWLKSSAESGEVPSGTA